MSNYETEVTASVEGRTAAFKAELNAFLEQHGYSLDTFDTFFTECVVKPNNIILVRQDKGRIHYELKSVEDHFSITGQMINYDNNGVFDLTGLDNLFTNCFEIISPDADANFYVCGNGWAKCWYDDHKPRPFIKRQRSRHPGGVQVQDTHFKKTHNKTRRW